jgi:exosortase/archaeosortase family protein
LHSSQATKSFLLRFSAAATLLMGAYYFPYQGVLALLRAVYLALYAHLAGAAIRIFDPTVQVHGTHIVGRTAFEFAMNCDAMDVTLLFAAAVFAFPASWRRRLVGFGCAMAGIAVLNVSRVVVLYLLRIHAPAWFDVFHVTLFPLVFAGATAAWFLAWAHGGRRAASPA